MKEIQTIEWKGTWRDEYLRWIRGFADGGVLVIGRDDDGQAVGVKAPPSAQLRVVAARHATAGRMTHFAPIAQR
jgi:hypothetical protein